MDSAGKQRFRDIVKNKPLWGLASDAMSKVLFPKAVKAEFGIAKHARFIFYVLVNFNKVLVQLPRHHGKSTYVTFVYVMWCILTRRKKFILILSSTGQQAVKFLARIKHYLTSKKIKQYYGDLSKSGSVVDTGNESFEEYVDADTKKRSTIWNYKEILIEPYGIRVFASSIGSANRGLLNIDDRPDLIILDDIEDRKNTNTKDLRDKLSDTIVEEIFPAGAIGCQYIFIGTICHYGSFLLKLRTVSDEWFFVPLTRATDTIDNILEYNKLLPSDFPDEYKFDPEPEYFTKDVIDLDGKHRKAGEKTPEVAIWKNRYTYQEYCIKRLEYRALGKENSFWQEFYNHPKSNEFKVLNDFWLVDDHKIEYDPNYYGEQVLRSNTFLFPNGKRVVNVYPYLGGDLAESEKDNSDWTVFHTVFTDPFGYVYVFPSYRVKEPDPTKLAIKVLNENQVFKFQACSFDGQHFQKWFKRVLEYMCYMEKDEKGKKIYSMPKVYQVPRYENKEKVIYSTLSPYINNGKMVFCGEKHQFENLFNEASNLGFWEHDDDIDGLCITCQNLRFPPIVSFDNFMPVQKNRKINSWMDEVQEEELWYFS